MSGVVTPAVIALLGSPEIPPVWKEPTPCSTAGVTLLLETCSGCGNFALLAHATAGGSLGLCQPGSLLQGEALQDSPAKLQLPTGAAKARVKMRTAKYKCAACPAVLTGLQLLQTGVTSLCMSTDEMHIGNALRNSYNGSGQTHGIRPLTGELREMRVCLPAE